MLRRVDPASIDFGDLRRQLDLPAGFSAGALAEAQTAAAAPLTEVASGRVDRLDVPFVTVDPPGARDLDQAVHLSRRSGGGYRVRYAIADVAAFVAPGGALHDETWGRGQTVYLPDGNVPLHPEVLSEGAVSLLPDQVRAVTLWTIDVDADAAPVDTTVERAVVRSRSRLDYAGVQADADAGRLPEPVALLPELGALLARRARARGAVNLPLPEQEVVADGSGWRLALRAPLAVEEHNAQISLLTGECAARLMLDGGVGLLRTMPAPEPEAVDRLRVAARALGIDWPEGATVGAVVAGLDAGSPRGAALLDHAAELLRGAGYTAFDGVPPAQPAHGGVGAPYAHVTAPLRRLADRYATEVCLALVAGREIPEWVREALPRLPGVMAATGRIAAAADRGAVDLAEAVILADRVGEHFEAAVIDVDEPARAAPAPASGPAAWSGRGSGGTVALDEPAVRARCEGDLPLGRRVRVRLTMADPSRREVRFVLS